MFHSLPLYTIYNLQNTEEAVFILIPFLFLDEGCVYLTTKCGISNHFCWKALDFSIAFAFVFLVLAVTAKEDGCTDLKVILIQPGVHHWQLHVLLVWAEAGLFFQTSIAKHNPCTLNLTGFTPRSFTSLTYRNTLFVFLR